jgi:hypothetical protein
MLPVLAQPRQQIKELQQMSRKLENGKNGNVVRIQSSRREPTTVASKTRDLYKVHEEIHGCVDRVEIGHGITSIDDLYGSGAVFLSDGNTVIKPDSVNCHMLTLTTEENTFEHVLTSDVAVVCGGETTRATAVASLRKVIEMIEQLSDEEFKS